MNSLYLGEKAKISYQLSINDKIKIYKTFATIDESYLKIMAERAYIELFRRPVPEMR
jgi:hypothetical protein